MPDVPPPLPEADASNRPKAATGGLFTRRGVLWQTAIGSWLWSRARWSTAANAQNSSLRDTPPRHYTAATLSAVETGLSWLAQQQKSDGGFGPPRSYARNVGVCALSGLAFLSQGTSSRWGSHLEGCTRYLLGRGQSDGLIVEADVVSHAPQYGHGFATLYLGQVYGQHRNPGIRQALQRAVTQILALQLPSGGWSYTSDPDDADVSITTCQVMALFSAQQAGIRIPPEAISRSLKFLKECQNPDGGFRYRRDDPSESLFPRSAAAVTVLQAAGLHADPVVLKGREYLNLGLASSPEEVRPPGTKPAISAASASTPLSQHAEYYYYGRLYATHAAWQVGGECWDHWFPVVRDELLQRRGGDEAWSDLNIGDVYATAVALNVLQFPLDRIPLLLLGRT